MAEIICRQNLERQTKFSAEQIEDASAVMLTFKSISGDTFLRAQTAAADLAAVMKNDLSGATLQLGKALENPVEGITALKRAGVSFTDEQKNLIKSLVESGNLLEAQQLVLTTLEGQVGGVAKQLGTQGLGGAFDLAKDQAGDLSKALGGLAASGGTLESVVHGIGNGFDSLTEIVENGGLEAALRGITIAGAGLAGASIAPTLLSMGAASVTAASNFIALARIGGTLNTVLLGTTIATRGLGVAMATVSWPIVAVGALAAGVAYLATETSEYTEQVKISKEVLDKQREIEELLTVASGARAKALKQERVEAVDATIAEIELAQARIVSLKASIEQNKEIQKKAGNQGAGITILKQADERAITSLEGKITALQERLAGQVKTIKEHTAAVAKDTEANKGNTAASEEGANSSKKTTEEKKKSTNALGEYITKLKEEGSEIGKSAEAMAIARAGREAENAAIKDGLSLTDASVQKRIEEAKAMAASNYAATEAVAKEKKAREELAQAVQKSADENREAAKKAQEEFEEPFKRAGENIQGTFRDMFADVAKNGKLNMRDLADSSKDIMFTMIGEVAAAMVFKPMIQPVLNQAMSGFSSIGGGNAGGVAGHLSSFGAMGGTGGMATALNNYGATKFGLSQGSSFVGPMQPGMAPTGVFGQASLGGMLSGAGMGLGIGSMNLFGGNSTSSTIGGTVGGLAGSYFGPLGSIAGGAIGSGIGGLFGPGAKVSAAEFAGNIGANDNLAGLSYGAKNGQVSQARGLSDALGQALAGLVANGIDIANENIRGAINSKSGNRFEAMGKSFGFDPQDAESVSLAIAQLSVELAKAGSNTGNLGIALQHIQTDGRKAEEILSDLNFAAMYDQLGKVQEPVSQYTALMEAQKKQYDDMIPVAERLGLATDKVRKAQELATAAMQDSFVKPISAAILEMTDPLAAQIQAEQERYTAQLRDAKALGAGLGEVERLHYLKMQELANQAGYFQQQVLANDNDIRQQQATIAQELANRYRAVGDNIKKTLADLSYGSLSTLTTKQKRDEAQAEVESLYKKAMLGNVDAQEQFRFCRHIISATV